MRNSFITCEQLESRRLLSATLVDGVLTVEGTTGDDVISLSLKAGDPAYIVVTENGVAQEFLRSDIGGHTYPYRSIFVYGRSGNDLIKVDNSNGAVDYPVFNRGVWFDGNGGNDTLIGGDSPDTLHGRDGDDKIYGGAGADVIGGGWGQDELHGGDGGDAMYGSPGDDRLYGEAGGDGIGGGAGNDRISGGSENDQLWGGTDNDTLLGDDGDDTLNGGLGNDDLYGMAGTDSMYGQRGNDDFFGTRAEVQDATLGDSGSNDVLG